MKTNSSNSQENKSFSTKIIGLLMFCFAQFQNTVYAQTDSVAVDSTAVKGAKNVFGAMKKIAAKEDSTLLSILGIIAVVSVVGFAMYLSFKSKPGDEEKQNRYANIKRTGRRR